MGKRTSQMNAAKTNNQTPKESLPVEEETGHRTNKNRPKSGPGANQF
ncbi:hypothetical protein [Halobacillus litoralis]|nr:hypothetical protein [Halobacillus litoralis]MYL37055.1 hypothetical protein [Halobacillus litoralis]